MHSVIYGRWGFVVVYVGGCDCLIELLIFVCQVIMYTMLCGKVPFHAAGASAQDIAQRICSGEVDMTDESWSFVSHDAKKVCFFLYNF